MGPTALISLLTGQALDAVNLLGDDERLSGASTLALLVGLVSLLLGILRFGFVVDFMSHSVMSSFCTASGRRKSEQAQNSTELFDGDQFKWGILSPSSSLARHAWFS